MGRLDQAKHCIWGLLAAILVGLIWSDSASAQQLQQARVTQVVNDVKLLPNQAAPRPAAVNDEVKQGTAVRTGTDSRTELTFSDLTITRLGANTVFSFKPGTRDLKLINGAILIQVPPHAPEVKVSTAAVSAAISGGTAIFDAATGKFMVLEGIGRIWPVGHPEQAVIVHAGEMVWLTPGGHISQPDKFNVALVTETSLLITDFAPLPNLDLIVQVIQQQQIEGGINPPLPPTKPPEQIVSQRNDASPTPSPTPAPSPTETPPTPTPTPATPTPTPTPATPTPTPTPATPTPTPTPATPTPTPTPATPTPTPTGTPSEVGPPQTISSPVPYIINSSSVISTDPTITTNGNTDFGSIYRGPADDGAFSLWALGSTSAFDTALKIDTEFFADPNNLPIAVLKFERLSITGNPTIDTTNGSTKLALIGVDGITTGPPGGVLTFTGLDLLALATVNGSINLTSDVSFQDLAQLAVYARGPLSDLIIDSPLSGIGVLKLGAERSIQLSNPGTMSDGAIDATAGVGGLSMNIGGSLLLNGEAKLNSVVLPGTGVADGANVTVSVNTDLINSSATDIIRLRVTNFNGHIDTGGNVLLMIGGNLTTGAGGLDLEVQNTAGDIGSGGNITLATGGNFSSQGQLTLLVANYDFTANPAGHIGSGGDLFVSVSGDLTADSIAGLLDNRAGGMIDSGASVKLNVGGALTTVADGTNQFGQPTSLSLVLSNRYDDSTGNTTSPVIGGNANVSLSAGSASIGGRLSAILSNRGGMIGADALVNLSIAHDMTVAGISDVELLNDGGTDLLTPVGGTIHGPATLQLSANNFTANALFSQIANKNGGVIDSNATLLAFFDGHFATPGTSPGNPSFDATDPGEADFLIQNQRNSSGTTGGSIGGDAMISFTAVSASIGGALDAEIRNVNGGMIHSAATVDFTIFDGNLATGSDLLLDIANRRQAGQASGGSIGTDASVSLNVSGDLTVQGNATLQILNDHIDTAGTTASSIGGNAFVSLSAANISASANSSTGSLGILNLFITNSNGGNIGGGAILTVGATTVSTADAFNVRIFNDGGSRIGAAANSSVSISGDVTAPGGVVVDILNGASTIGSTANIFFSAGNVTSGNNTFFDMLNENGTIQLGAEVDVFATNISSTGSLNTYIDSNNGHIGGAAAVVFASQDISSTGDTFFDVLNQGGSIASTASVNVSVNSATAGGILTANVRNQGGTIGSDALLTFSSAANLQSNTAFFEVLNSGGAIHGNATDFVSAANIVATTGYNQIIDNQSAGVIDGSAGVTLRTGDLMTTSGGTFLQILNQNGGSIGSAAGITFLGSNVNTTSFNEVINNQNGGIINGSASVLLNLTGDLTASGDVFLQILKQSTSGSSVINGDASVLATVGNVSSAGSFLASIYNNFVGAPVHGSAAVDISTLGFSVGNPLAPVSATVEMTNIFGTIDQSASVGLDASGPINVNGDLAVQLFNGMANSGSAGGHIGVNANVGLSGSSISVTGTLTLQVDSTASFIGGNASVDLTSSGNISAGDTTVQIISSDNGLGQPGEIDGFANITIVSDADLTASSLFTFIDDRHAGIVGTAATIGVQLAGALNTASDAILGISTQNGGSGGGTIGSDATVNLQLGSSSVGGVFESFISTNGGGLIQGNAGISMVTSADLSATQGIAAFIADTAFGPNGVLQGGSIGGNALVTLHGQNITTPSTATGIPGTDLMALEASIYSNAGGAVGGSAIVDVSATNQISAPGTALFWVANGNYQSIGPGQIGDDARVSLTASSISTGDLLVQILNYGGSQIGNNADVNISTNSLSVNGNLDSQIDNGNAGQIGGHAVINASVANTATVSGDASFQIFGSDGAASAAINFNGGAYTVGGNFRAVIDGAGTIGLNTASIQADVLKVGVFGDNGTLTVGGGSLNANTLLKLYAPGSNGVIDFVANVTLTSQGSAAVIAANTVTIENSVVVTITGSGGSALVYTNVPNYSGPGGNGTTSGTFGGNGATTSPLPSAPPFDASSDKPSGSTTTASNPVQGAGGGREEIATSKFHGNSFSAKPHNATATTSPQPTVTAGPSGVRVADTNQLLDMLNQAGPTGSTTADGTAPGKKNGSRRQREQLSRRASADQSTRMNRARDERLRFPIR